jgi:hypothetical protein
MASRKEDRQRELPFQLISLRKNSQASCCIAKQERKTVPAMSKTTSKAIAMTPSKVMARRTNWGIGKNLDILKVAVDEWKNKSGRYFDSNGEPITLSQFFLLL